jgi:DNA invertase Pin-like site-specific DNA recombinase
MIPHRKDGRPMDIGYARVSTIHQDTAIQEADLEKAGCWPIYTEQASGVAKERPVRDQVLAQLKPGDTLTVWKLDRLGRNLAELLAIIADLNQRGVRFKSITQGIDTATPTGRAFLGILGVLAEYEREMILERTAAGHARRLEEGKRPGGPPLFGWKWQNGDQVQDPEEVEAVERIVDLVLDDGLSLSNVADRMNADPDAWPAPAKSDRWIVSSLHRILTNPRTREVIPDRFDKLQGRIRRTPGRGAGGGRPTDHLLSGILVCGKCETPLYHAVKIGKPGGPPQDTYRCKVAHGSGGRHKGCGQTQVAASRVDPWAREAFLAAVLSPSFAETLEKRRAALLSEEISIEDLDDWRREIDELEQVLPTRFGTPDMKRRHDDLRRMVDAATARLMSAPELEEMLDLPQTEDKLRAAWDAWTVAKRREWLRRVLDAIVVKPAGPARGPATDVESRLDPVWKM